MFYDLEQENRFLRKKIAGLEAELEEQRRIHVKTSQIMMSGEKIREKLMMEAIMKGTFSQE